MVVILAAAGGFSLGILVATLLAISKEHDDRASELPLAIRVPVESRPHD